MAAGEETLLWAMLDATVRLAADPDTPILLVYADEPLPAEYQDFSSRPEYAHAIAFLLRPGKGISLEWKENRGCAAPSREPLSLSILTHLLGQRDHVEWHGERVSVHGHIHHA